MDSMGYNAAKNRCFFLFAVFNDFLNYFFIFFGDLLIYRTMYFPDRGKNMSLIRNIARSDMPVYHHTSAESESGGASWYMISFKGNTGMQSYQPNPTPLIWEFRSYENYVRQNCRRQCGNA